jgi:hypothetical protein
MVMNLTLQLTLFNEYIFIKEIILKYFGEAGPTLHMHHNMVYTLVTFYNVLCMHLLLLYIPISIDDEWNV